MNRIVLRANIRQVTSIQCGRYPEGSCGIDEALLEKIDVGEFEKIELHNVNSGERVPTYFIRDKRGTGDISFNSSAVCNWLVGDFFIIYASDFSNNAKPVPKGVGRFVGSDTKLPD
ncbi:aspartate 1-decarboxylase [Undibacterium arcticum]|uniref:Aspartate 1-decarboxylase n=1 Tax=Undibacterium arcticum TaxID=1762892 RepID=A0ABV7EWX0_9BURK